MKKHTTNYFNTLVEVADDCPVEQSEIPPIRGEKRSVANMQYDILSEAPYKYTSDEIFFTIFAKRKDVVDSELENAREQFFSKGQPCFRASPLTKRYGWGVHSDTNGKVALVARESDVYEALQKDDTIKKVKAMRSKRR